MADTPKLKKGGNPNGNPQNLIQSKARSAEEARALRSKAGKKAAETKKDQATFKLAYEWALDLPAFRGNPTVDAVIDQFPSMSNREAMAIAMTARAIRKGDVKAFVAIRDTIGEAPVQNVKLANDEPMTIKIETID